MDLRHNVLTVCEDGCPFGCPQGYVQDCAILREVNFVSSKHRVDLRSQAGFLGQLNEELDGFVRDAVLRIVEEDARSLGRQSLTAFGILCE